jgi:hypothetical protein
MIISKAINRLLVLYSTIGLVVKFVVAIDEPWVRFPDGAEYVFLALWCKVLYHLATIP